MLWQGKSGSAIPPDEIRTELVRVLSSGHFINARRSSRFLRFVVEQAVECHAERVREQVLGREVFDRDESFNPSIDPIVRVEANRLRSKLQRYFRSEGRSDPVLIQLKKGGYVPWFRRRVTLTPRPATARAPAVAVLPLQNLDDDPDQDFLCEGIAEELIRALSKVDGLRVIAWSSTRRLKGAAYDIRSVGAQLKVSAALEGSIRRVGRRMRIAAQLIDTGDCSCLWSDVVESGAGDVPAIPERIAHAIVGALPVERVRSPARAAMQMADKPELYSLYLKARYHVNRRTAEGLAKATEYFECLIAEQPDYARAHAGLAEACALHAWYCFTAPNLVMPKAKASALKAVKADSRLAEAHLASGLVSELYDWDWSKARQSLRLAVDLSPGSATTLFEYGFLLSRMGELDESFLLMRRARELDPLSPVINTNLGVNYYYQRQYGLAVRQYIEALELDSSYQPAYYRLALAHLQQGSVAEAQACLDKAEQLTGSSSRLRALSGYAMARAGRRVAARTILNELLAPAQDRYISPVSVALLYLGLHETRAALDWLEHAREEHDVSLVDLNVDPLYDPLRSLPRFRRLLASMNLV